MAAPVSTVRGVQSISNAATPRRISATTKELKAEHKEVARLMKELEKRDGISSDPEYRRILAQLLDSNEVLVAMEKEIEDQRRVADWIVTPAGAPRVRGWYVERRVEVVQTCDRLKIARSSARKPGVVGLAGPRGVGKSTVASMVIAREDVRASFPRGVLWLLVGKAAKDRLPSLMLDLAGMVHETVLSKSCRPPRNAGESIEDGVAYIKEMVAEGRESFLVVADDVWEVEILQELERVGACVLYTTCQNSLLPDAPPVQVHEFVKEEVEVVLRRAAGLDETAILPDAAYELMRRLGVLPEGLLFPSEAAAALLYDDFLPAEGREDLEVAEEAAATLERWYILARGDGGNYCVRGEYRDLIQGCLSATTRDRVLPRWLKYMSGVRALHAFPADDLESIWRKFASEGGDLDFGDDARPYERELEATDLSDSELPKALKAAGVFFQKINDAEGAYTAYSKLLKIQENTDTSDGLAKGVLSTLGALSDCAKELGRPEEAAELERRAEAIIEENLEAVSEEISEEMDILCTEEFSWSCCFGDDACVEDSAFERVHITHASNNKYVVVGLGGATVRMAARLDSPVLTTLPQATMVAVAEVRGRRAHILKPMDGWVSIETESGYEILEPVGRPTKYKVHYPEGIFVRSSPDFSGRIVRIAPFGTVLKATGKTRIRDAVERVQVEDGWVSARLREDGTGQLLIMPIT